MRKFLVITTSKYPNGDAGSVRQHIFAKMIKDMNYKVEIIGMGDSTNYKKKEFEGIEYTSFRSSKNTIISRALNLILFKSRLKSYLKVNKDITDILMISVPPNVIKYLKKNIDSKVRLYHDSVEWYSKEQFLFGNLSLEYQINNFYNKKWIDEKFSVIAISRYLESHFKEKGLKVIRIPILLDVSAFENSKRENTSNKVKIIYAGSLGNNKDYLLEFLSAIDLLEYNQKKKIEFKILGINKEELMNKLKLRKSYFEDNTNIVIAMGRVSRSEVIDHLNEADFSILFRNPSLRYAQAGFPTKVVESLSTKTSVILNLSSDLNDFLKNNKNCIVVDDLSVNKIMDKLKTILNMSRTDIDTLKENARITAEEFFDYKNHTKVLKEFFDT